MKTTRETVLITGATSGIGNDFARIFAERGYDLFLASRNLEKMDGIRKKLEDLYGISVTTMSIDLAKPSSARKVYEETISRKMNIDILVNNAGVGVAGEHTDLNMSKVEEMIQLNVTTLTQLCALFGQDMKKKGRGYILNVASTAAFQPTAGMATYGATKAFLLHWSLALGEELRGSGVQVLAVCPGPTATEFFRTAGLTYSVTPGFIGQTPQQVVEASFRALAAGKSLVVSGWKNKVLAAASSMVPKALAARLAARVIARYRTAAGRARS